MVREGKSYLPRPEEQELCGNEDGLISIVGDFAPLKPGCKPKRDGTEKREPHQIRYIDNHRYRHKKH